MNRIDNRKTYYDNAVIECSRHLEGDVQLILCGEAKLQMQQWKRVGLL